MNWRQALNEIRQSKSYHRAVLRQLPNDLLEEMRSFDTCGAAEICERYYLLSDAVKNRRPISITIEEWRALRAKYIPALEWKNSLRLRLSSYEYEGQRLDPESAPGTDMADILQSRYQYNLPSRRPTLDEYDARIDHGAQYQGRYGIWRYSALG